jgi:BirA family biotin operon repressor/biotin-[acetyl-CoA-carboxylase] ligase
MAFALGPKALAAGFRLAAYETVGSTSTEALERASAGDPGKLWVVAKEQTAGPGRRGRPWQTRPGNLAASLLMIQSGPSAAAARLGFVAGLALESAIRAALPSIRRLRLKWPNDVLIDGAKVAGILLEAVTQNERTSVVVGIGVNVASAPPGLPYPVTFLGEHGAGVSVEALFAALAEAWVEQEKRWNGGRGFGAIRERWLECAAGLGAPIAVRIGDDLYRGTFETIDDEGRLVVRAGDGSARAVSAGDVHFGAVSTAGS